MFSAENRVVSMIEITDRLTALLQEEANLIKQMKVSKISSLQDAKMRLTDAYQARVEEIQQNADKYKNIPAHLKQKLTDASMRFKEAVMKDINAIHAAKTANERVVEAIASALLEQQQMVSGYNSKGGLEKTKKTAYQQTQPSTLSETL